MSKKPVLLLGSGGHAKVVADLLQRNNRAIEGILDPNQKAGSYWLDCKVLGDDLLLQNLSPDQFEVANGVGMLPYSRRRFDLFLQISQLGFTFSSLVHPTAIVAPTVKFGEGVQVMAGSIVQVDASIGNNVIINTGVQVDHECIIEEHAHLAPGVIVCGGVTVGERAYIGAGSTISQGVNVGEGSVIAAGSVVIENIPPNQRFTQKKKNQIMPIRSNERVT